MPRSSDRLRGGVAGFHSPDSMALRNLESVCSLDQFVPERTCLSPYGHFPVRADVRVVPVDAACLQYGRFLAGVRHAVRSRGVASLPYSYLSSAPPSGENEAVIVPLQKDAWVTVISNPALVVGSGTEDAVRYTLLPVLKARSVRPCGMLSWGNGKAERAGEKELRRNIPESGTGARSPGNVPSGNGGYGRAMHLCWKIFLSRCARESVRTGTGCCHGNAAGGGS